MNFHVLYICEWQTNIFTSKKIPTSRAFDINLRSIIAFRENGKGYTGLESVCSYLNLVPPMNKINFILLTAKSSYKKTAEICMKSAADEVRCLVAEEKHDTVSENSNITTIENCSDGTLIVLLFRIVLLMMSLLLILLFQVMVLGRKGDMTHLTVLQQ